MDVAPADSCAKDIGDLPDAPNLEEMAEYEVPAYSRRQYIEAGKFIAQSHPYTPETLEPFRIANNWRSAHVYPLLRIRHELSMKVAKVLVGGGFTATRIKRMASIRKKLRQPNNATMQLIQIQDIAGARAVLRSKKEIENIIREYRDGNTRHQLKYESPYVESPKTGGYRSHHIVLKYCPSEADSPGYGRLSVELQIRTRLQHCWATAVEAVGLFRSEDLKGGEGHRDWLRLFELMSTEFAEIEDLPIVPNTPSRRAERKYEILDLNKRIDAMSTLEVINKALKRTEEFYFQYDPGYYIISFDKDRLNVKVEKFISVGPALSEYYDEETGFKSNVVLVEIDRVTNLRQAYPNYFLDIERFKNRLKKVIDSAYAAKPPSY